MTVRRSGQRQAHRDQATDQVKDQRLTAHLPSDDEHQLPFETERLRAELKTFLNQTVVPDGTGSTGLRLGAITWGAYAFFDYDHEPIYVGQTSENLGTRIRRHLTNQRSDAVAMKVLDPFEVHTIKVWPLPQFEGVKAKSPAGVAAKAHLGALERAVFMRCLEQSKFGAILNEKDPPESSLKIEMPVAIERCIVSPEVSKLRDHPDLRIARRAATLARLAQVISERKVNTGLRRALLAQATRLQDLAQRRYDKAPQVSDDEDLG